MKYLTALLLAALLAFAPLTAVAASEAAGSISIDDGEGGAVFLWTEEERLTAANVRYDPDSHTLTLTDAAYPDAALTLSDMGDLTVVIEGDCALGGVTVEDSSDLGTSANLVGDGTLTINERQHSLAAISSHGGGADKRFQIADSLNLTIYGTDDLIFSATLCNPRAETVLTVGDNPVAGLTAAEDVYQRAEAATVVYLSDADRQLTHGVRVTALADPDGVYAAAFPSDEPDAVYVTRYLYVDALGAYAVDPTFRDGAHADAVRLSRAAFAAQYQTVTAPQPETVYFTAPWNDRESGGESGVQLFCTADPAGVYVGVEEPDADALTVCRLLWDADAQVYRTDSSFAAAELPRAALAAHGYVLLTTEEQDNVYYECLRLPSDSAPQAFPRLTRRSDPEGIYVETGVYDSGRQSGVCVEKVRFAADGTAYIDADTADSAYDFRIPDEAFEAETPDFSYMMRTSVEENRLRFLSESAAFEDYALHGERWERDGAVYALTTWEQDGKTFHNLVPLTYLEEEGHFYADTELTDVDPETLRAEGYVPVYSGAPAPFVTQGLAEIGEWPVCRDDSGHSYLLGWDGAAYAYSADRTVEIGGVTCCLPTRAEGVDASTLHDTEQTVHTGWYAYTLRQAVWRHEGAPALTRGDVNADGRVDINDATALQRYLAESLTLTPAQQKAADADRSGRLDIDDVTMIQKILAELV